MNKFAVAILILGFGTVSLAAAQDAPAPEDQAAIVWTGMQQPVPEPAQNTAAREIPPAPQQGAEQNTERSPEQREQPNVQNPGKTGEQAAPAASSGSENVRSMTGTVVKENNGYFLRTPDNSEFQLDDVSKVKDFENQSVTVTGTVDSSTRTIHVHNVKPGS